MQLKVFRPGFATLITMKLLMLLTIVACLQTSARGFGQTVSLSLNKAPLEKVFKEITRQTGYYFVYTRFQLKISVPVTCEVSNGDLKEVLTLCFRNQPLSYVIEDRYVVVQTKKSKPETSIPPIPPMDITGRVINEDGEPLAGVTITAKHSNKGTFTNDKGEFLLKGVNDNDILIITSVGYYKEEIEVNKQSFFMVRLRIAVGSLDETIVMAYGKTSRRLNTGNISKVTAEEISRQPVSNPLATLSGRVSGLQVTQGSGMPGSFYTVRLRGQNSIANGNDPLIIVDGIPFPSTTLNGTFGGGGGATNSPLNNINPEDIESIEVLKDADATAIYGSRGANGVILITTKKGLPGNTRVDISVYTGWGKIARRLELMNTPEYLMMRREGFSNDGTTPTIANARDLLVWDTTRYTDWQKVLIRNTMTINDIKASISGGTIQTQFMMGAGYHKETTVMLGSFGEEKLSFTFSLNHQSENKRLRLSLDGNFLHNNNLLPQTDISSSINLPPDAPKLYDSLGNLNWEKSTWVNPMSILLKKFETTTENIICNALISYKILPGLELKATFGFNNIAQREHVQIPISSYDPALPASGTAGFGNNVIRTFIAEPQLNFRKNFGKKNLALLAGYTLQSTTQNALYQSGTGYTSDELLGSLKAASFINTSNEIDSRYRYLGLFSRLNFDWDKKYFVTITLRRDGSSRYGPANRFANFGSLGFAWVFKREKFIGENSILSFGKLKGSAGVTGNDQIGDYKYLDLYSPYSYSYLGTTPFQPVQLFNSNFGWERVKKLEAGLELAFFRERILFTANYYHNITNKQLVSYALPQVTGFPGVLQNLPAKILNHGIELELSGLIIDKSNFKWSGSLNFSVPKNKLLAFNNIEGSSYANTYVVGQSLFIAQRYAYTGVDPNIGNYTFLDVNGDGKISSPVDMSAVVFTGQQYFGGLQNNFSHKRLSFSFLFQFVRQENAPNYLSRFGRPGTMTNQPTFVLDRWRSPGDESTFQKYANSNSASNTAFSNYRSSDAAFSDASFIRLRNVEMSYQLIAKKSKQLAIEQGILFMQAHNLFTITSYKGLDPETKSVLPPVAVLTVGVRFTF